MRTRIALTAALAVLFAIPTFIFTLFAANPADAVAHGRHTAVVARHRVPRRHHAVHIKDKLMSYSQADKLANLVQYADAVHAQQLAKFVKDLAFFQAVAAQQQQAAAAQQQAAAAQQQAAAAQQQAAAAQQAANSFSAIPAAWVPTALCEEGGRNDPYAGYFGILAWNGFDGYPTAGSAPLSVQLAWEATYIGAPPDAPGQCHSY